METGYKVNFFPCLHNFDARLLLKKVLFTENVNKNRWYLFVFDCFLNGRNLIFNDIDRLFSLCFSFWNGMSSTKGTYNSQYIFVFFLCNLNGFEHFYLILGVKAITWLNLNCCCSQFAHTRKVFIKMSNQLFYSRFCNRLCCESYSKSLVIDINISFSIKFHLIFSWSITHK